MQKIFFDTYYENASPLICEESSPGVYELTLIPDHERLTRNCQTTHWNFRILAEPEMIGSSVLLRFRSTDNTWNGSPNPPLRYDRLTSCVRHGNRDWTPVRMRESGDPGVRKELLLDIQGVETQVCNVVPYTESDLNRLLKKMDGFPRVRVYPIGASVEGRPLEMIEFGNPRARHKVLLRARAHPWETGGNWLIEGLFDRLMKNDVPCGGLLEKVCFCVLPMACKDGVARGMTRYNIRGCDLNRGWRSTDSFDPVLCPENHALQTWLNHRNAAKDLPDLAICIHNDDDGMIHLSSGSDAPAGYGKRAKSFTDLLRKHTWFAEGVKESLPGEDTFASGLCRIYGIDSMTYELNASWSVGLHREILHTDWIQLGAAFVDVIGGYYP